MSHGVFAPALVLAASMLAVPEVDPAEEKLAQMLPVPAPEVEPARLDRVRGADRAEPVARGETWDTWGTLRGRVEGGSDPVLDRGGTRTGRPWWASSRLIAGVDWDPTSATHVELEIEALNGTFAGPLVEVGTVTSEDTFRVSRSHRRDVYQVLPRKLGVRFTHPQAGRVAVGLQTFTWGLGMLANDGAGDTMFGDPWQGNVVARLGYAVAPWRADPSQTAAARGLGLFVAADVAVRDDNASLLEGDLAISGLLGLRLQTPHLDAGALGVVRWQRDRNDPNHPATEATKTLVFPVDVYARVRPGPPSADRGVTLEVEGALIPGTTDRPYTEETREGARVLSGGVLGRVRYDDDTLRITAWAEVGAASGDADGRDGVVRTFQMHSDHNAGLILFDHLLPLLAARGADRVSDPNLSAAPPPGLRFTVPQGGVSNAAYLHPALRYRPVEALDIRLGAVFAWTASELVDLYESALAGGYNATPGGVVGGKPYLGTEADLGLRYLVSLPGRVRVEVGAEGALFEPGPALDGLDLPLQALGRGRLDLLW